MSFSKPIISTWASDIPFKAFGQIPTPQQLLQFLLSFESEPYIVHHIFTKV